MPDKKSLYDKLMAIIRASGDDFQLSTSKTKINCKICKKDLKIRYKSDLDDHAMVFSHTNGLSIKNEKLKHVVDSEGLMRDVFMGHNVSLNICDSPVYRSAMKKFNVKTFSSRTENCKLKKAFESRPIQLCARFMKKKLIMIFDSTKNDGKNYTVVHMSTTEEPSNFELVYADASDFSHNHETIESLIINSLSCISQPISNVVLISHRCCACKRISA
ncbi:unnamed protein product [Dimorphilus gyrociliatus]|uniref:Uncharacterized protein n=1 Tax=Dimorphilus gyrociliatus TaxID=2664684 RepID=A0A7I8WEN6_9ANNE|nr:unnamed protein product [Dimorphilus gyrociliatus]